jgi:hypothetical protein
VESYHFLFLGSVRHRTKGVYVGYPTKKHPEVFNVCRRGRKSKEPARCRRYKMQRKRQIPHSVSSAMRTSSG